MVLSEICHPSLRQEGCFDRSWYNRGGVEKVMGFCTYKLYINFLQTCPEFERMVISSGTQLVKYWFSVSAEEQMKGLRLVQPTLPKVGN